MQTTKIKREPGRPDKLTARIAASGLHLPKTMTVMVTSGCNLACRHCWLDCRPLDKAVPVPSADILRLIDAFAQLGGEQVELTGGEILSHPDWQLLATFCSDHRQIKKVCLQTNATLLGRKHTDVLQALRPEKLTIQVSLDGARPRTHNLVRGPGGFAHAMAGLRLLAEVGLGSRTQVAFTEMAHNINELPELLELIDKMGIGGLISGTLVTGGRAAASAHIRLPSPSQYWELIDYYQNDSVFRTLYDKSANIAAIEWFKNRSEIGPCGCGCLKNLFVDAHGFLYPCTMLRLDSYAVGGVYSRPLQESIADGLTKWHDIPKLSRDRHRMIPACMRCAFKNHCAGGCMGRAAASGGELMVPEDRCSLRKAVYTWTRLPGVGAYCRKG